MTHTFKVGDRAIGHAGMKSKANEKEPGTVVEVKDNGAEVRMDRSELNRSDPRGDMWFFSFNELTHDTDFQVGDWVRYEKVDEVGTEKWNGKVGVITFVDNKERFPATSVDGIAERLLQANLVKIQPPQEKPMDTQEEPEPTDPIESALLEKARTLNAQAKLANACLAQYRDLLRAIRDDR